LGVAGSLNDAQLDGCIAGMKLRAPVIYKNARPQDGVSALRVQQRKPHILRPDRAALHSGHQNEVTRRPLINEPEQMLKRTKLAMHLQSLTFA
jgi:hypothetical protein